VRRPRLDGGEAPEKPLDAILAGFAPVEIVVEKNGVRRSAF